MSSWVFGTNLDGALGMKITEAKLPQRLDTLPANSLGIRDISSGRNHNLICLENGDLYTWGSNNQGTIGKQK